MFYADIVSDVQSLSGTIGKNLELIDVKPGRKQIKLAGNMAQYVSLTYCWRAKEKINENFFIRTRLVNSKSGKTIVDKIHIPTHDLFSPKLWEQGRVVREKHVVWIPANSPSGVYEIWVNNSNNDASVVKAGMLEINRSSLNILY